VIDEAHRLRNVYKPSNKIGNAIKGAPCHSAAQNLTFNGVDSKHQSSQEKNGNNGCCYTEFSNCGVEVQNPLQLIFVGTCIHDVLRNCCARHGGRSIGLC
jgi:hypothetical protein